jgi:osmotically-inducible protein OsmY
MHFANQCALILFLALMLSFALGCSKPPQPKAEASAGSSSAPATQQSSSSEGASQQEKSAGQRLDEATAQAKRGAGDAALTAKVKTALANDVGLKTLKIDVDANSGVVSLKGQVDNDDTKKRAQEIAEKVQGVTWVQNQLTVAPRPS